MPAAAKCKHKAKIPFDIFLSNQSRVPVLAILLCEEDCCMFHTVVLSISAILCRKGRQTPVPAAPQTQPRPPFIRPTFSQAPRPTQPPPPAPQPRQPSPTLAQPPRPSTAPPLRPATALSPPTIVSRAPPSPRSPASPSLSPSPSPSPPNVTSSPTPSMTSPITPVTSSFSRTTSSEFIPKESTKTSPMVSPVSPTKPQVSEELPPPASSLNSTKITFPPKSSSYPATSFADSATPTASPRAIEPLTKSPPLAQSPRIYTRSPPPISLPPQSNPSNKEPESEPKVLVQEVLNKQVVAPASKDTLVKGFNSGYNNSSKYSREADRHMLHYDSEDGRNVKILTLAGENKGAIMDLGLFSRRNSGGKQGYGGTNSTVGDETQESEDFGTSKADWSTHKDMVKTSHLPMNAYVNSNVQGSNNSILINCTITQNDPGVHFYLSKKPMKGNGKDSDHKN